MSKSNAHKEYFFYKDKYTKKYGSNCIILFCCGFFFEIYSLSIDDLKPISVMLNMVLTKKNKKKDEISESNPYLVGFPCHTIVKNLKILVDNNYTVVVVDQVTPPPHPKRAVVNIYSKGTYIDEIASPDANNIVCLYIEDLLQRNGKIRMCIGMSVVDLSTGETCVHEAVSYIGDEKYALDEASRFIGSFDPKEIIVYRKKLDNKKKTLCMDQNSIILYLEIESKQYHYYTRLEKGRNKLSFQEELLGKIYTNTDMLSPIIYLDLETKPHATQSYILLLDYAYQHNETIINNLYKPSFFENNTRLILGNNAVCQLNIFKNNDLSGYNKQYKSLFDVVNHTSTAIGRRYLRSILNTPILNKNELKLRYSYTEEFIKNGLYKEIESHLIKIYDIERLQRRIALQKIHPFELVRLMDSYKVILVIIELFQSNNNLKNIIPNNNAIENLKKFINKYDKKFNEIELNKYRIDDIEVSLFHKGRYNKIDKYQKVIDKNMTFMNNICDVLSEYITDRGKAKFIKKNDVKIIVKSNDRDGYYLSTTKTRAQSLKKKFKELEKKMEGETVTIPITDDYELDPSELTFKILKGETKIFFEDLKIASDEIIDIKKELIPAVERQYDRVLKYYYTKFNNIFKKLNKFVAIVDFIKSNSKTAVLYNYCKPKIVTKNNKLLGNGFIRCTQLRHPVVERIINNVEYVPHDITLGKDENYEEGDDCIEGMLLFSINGAGKSVMMKSIGLSIIMAQCGMYVPATSYEYSPYESLYCRITGNDNLFKGLSSFTLEMTELRAILKRSGPKTLVIGDEVCRGTEQISGCSIVASTLITLSNTGSSFIFATHLHKIAKMKRIKELKNVRAFHLTVEYDEEKDVLVFDRKLKPGLGPEVYGVTVAKYIIQDNEFMKLTQEIKNELMNIPNELLLNKTSPYNSKVYVNVCAICHKNVKEYGYLHTHHINHQKDCDNGFVNAKPHIQKNHGSNLVVLCRKCHHKVHDNEIDIIGYKDTSKGRLLEYTKK